MNDALGGVEMRLGFDHVERRLQRLRIRRAIGLVKEGARQPTCEAFRADRPRLAMTVDVEIGVAGPVRYMEQIDGLRESEQYVGLRLRPPARSNTGFLGDRLVERGDAAACALESGTQGFEGGAIGLSQIGERSEDLRSEGRARISCRIFDQAGERIAEFAVDDVRLDALGGARAASFALSRVVEPIGDLLRRPFAERLREQGEPGALPRPRAVARGAPHVAALVARLQGGRGHRLDERRRPWRRKAATREEGAEHERRVVAAADLGVRARELRDGGEAARALDEIVAVDLGDLARPLARPFDRLAADVRRGRKDGRRPCEPRAGRSCPSP
jgi:hypothetical protein